MNSNFDLIQRSLFKAYDAVEAAAGELLLEIFPYTTRDNATSTYGLIERWEAVYEITPPSGATLEERQSIILANVAAVGGLTISYYEGIIATLGYSIGTHAEVSDPHARITEGDFPPFRAGLTEVGAAAVFNQSSGQSQHTICVRGSLVESDTALQSILNKYVKANKEFIFINE